MNKWLHFELMTIEYKSLDCIYGFSICSFETPEKYSSLFSIFWNRSFSRLELCIGYFRIL